MGDDDLAYGHNPYAHGGGPPEETDRGFLGDTYRRFAGFGKNTQGQQESVGRRGGVVLRNETEKQLS